MATEGADKVRPMTLPMIMYNNVIINLTDHGIQDENMAGNSTI